MNYKKFYKFCIVATIVKSYGIPYKEHICTVPYFIVQGDQKLSVHLTITLQSSGAQRFFVHPV